MEEAIISRPCKNCGHHFTDNFCNKCGQPEAHRITLKHVLHDVIHVFLHADKGIFPYIADLLVAPGKLALGYIHGKRRIFNPYQYFIISVGVLLLLMSKSGFYDQMETIQQSDKLPGFVAKGMADYNFFIRKNGNIITFLFMPLMALSSWLFFKKRKENYAEHFTMVVFIMSQVNTINAIIMFFCLFFKVPLLYTAAVSFVLTVFCLTLLYIQFYNLSMVKSFFKGLLVELLAVTFQFVVMAGLLAFYIIYLAIVMGPHKS